jgi:hypothetical protein
VLYWLAGESGNFHKKYETFGRYRGGGGEPEVYFMRELPEQRSIADFV